MQTQCSEGPLRVTDRQEEAQTCESFAGNGSHAEATVRLDGYTRLCLTVIAGLLTVLIIGLWAQKTPAGPDALAQMPSVIDPAAQRYSVTKAVEQSNAKLDELIKLLRSGEAKVQVIEEPKAGRPENVRPVGSGK